MRLARDHALALVALALALAGLLAGGRGPAPARIGVVVAARTLSVDAVVGARAVRIVSIDARDRTPGMATSTADVIGRTARVRLSAGDYIVRAAVAEPAGAVSLRVGERAVPLSLETSAAPPLVLLRAGAHVDVVAEHDADRDGPAHSELVARDLALLASARSSDDGLVVTVRAPLATALTLATAQAQARRLRLLVRPANGQVAGG